MGQAFRHFGCEALPFGNPPPAPPIHMFFEEFGCMAQTTGTDTRRLCSLQFLAASRNWTSGKKCNCYSIHPRPSVINLCSRFVQMVPLDARG